MKKVKYILWLDYSLYLINRITLCAEYASKMTELRNGFMLKLT